MEGPRGGQRISASLRNTSAQMRGAGSGKGCCVLANEKNKPKNHFNFFRGQKYTTGNGLKYGVIV